MGKRRRLSTWPIVLQHLMPTNTPVKFDTLNTRPSVEEKTFLNEERMCFG